MADIQLGVVMAEVHIDIGGGHTIVSAITRDSAQRVGLSKGDHVVAIITSTVLVGT